METHDPKAVPREGALPLEIPKEALWSALAGEPNTSLVILTLEGQILYLNEQCAKMFIGPNGKTDQLVGKFFKDLFKPAWCEERLRVLKRVSESGKPLMMRTIWRGWQQFSWIHAIDPEVEEETEDEWKPCAMPPRFLVTTRRVAGDDSEELIESEMEVVESEIVDLGPLEVLTARELEVLALIGQGMSLKEIARTLFRSVKTIDNHRQSIGKKLNVTDRVVLADVAKRAGLTVEDAERARVEGGEVARRSPNGHNGAMETRGVKPETSPGASSDVSKEALWATLTSDPTTGVGIVSIDGQVLYLNEQSARIFHGPNAKPADYVGKFWHELHEPSWYEQRLDVLRNVAATGKPVMMRTIWRGWQQFSWVQPIEGECEEETGDEWKGCAVPQRFLITTRRAATDDKTETLVDGAAEVIESDVSDLGALDVLTARELEVLALIGQGMSLKEIARTLSRSVKTIDNHRQAIGKKLNITDRVVLAEVSRRAGLTLQDAERPRA